MKIDVGYNKNCVILFINLFEVVEKWNNDFGFNIMCKMFSEGYIVYVFSIVFSDFGEEYINLVCQGSIRLEVKFVMYIIEILNCLVYVEFFVLFEIDQLRDIKYI